MDEPIDQLHADCTDLRRRINELYAALHNQVARWEPKPPPWPHTDIDQPAAPAAADRKGNNHA